MTDMEMVKARSGKGEVSHFLRETEQGKVITQMLLQELARHRKRGQFSFKEWFGKYIWVLNIPDLNRYGFERAYDRARRAFIAMRLLSVRNTYPTTGKRTTTTPPTPPRTTTSVEQKVEARLKSLRAEWIAKYTEAEEIERIAKERIAVLLK